MAGTGTRGAGETPTPDPSVPLEEQPDKMLLAMLDWGEARGECMAAQFAVARTALNRLASGRWGKSLREVILAPRQFSCFNPSDPNRKKLLDPLKHDSAKAWRRCYAAATAVLATPAAPDPAPGADHYYDISLDQAGMAPAWARKMTFLKQIGRLKFFRSK